jgi:hypothetical protein
MLYCPHCGAESTQGLNYCNRCGGNLNPLATVNTQTAIGSHESRPHVSTGAAWAAGMTMFLVVCVGLAAVFGTISDLAHFITPNAVIALAVCGSATILGSILLLSRFWMRLLLNAPAKKDAAPRLAAPAQPTGELGPARQNMLPDAHFTSVTEHTTRTLKSRQ